MSKNTRSPHAPGTRPTTGFGERSRQKGGHRHQRRNDPGRGREQRGAAGESGLDRLSPADAIVILRVRVAELAYGSLTDDLCRGDLDGPGSLRDPGVAGCGRA